MICPLLGSTGQDDRVCSCCFNLHSLPREHNSSQRLLINVKLTFERDHGLQENGQHRASSDSLGGALITFPMHGTLGLQPPFFILTASQEDTTAAAQPYTELVDLSSLLFITWITKYFLQQKWIPLTLKLRCTAPQTTAQSCTPYVLYPHLAKIGFITVNTLKTACMLSCDLLSFSLKKT